MNKIPIAHSSNDKVGKQLYRDHIHGVYDRALEYLMCALRYHKSKKLKKIFINIIKAAAIYHDFGKLDEISQKLLDGSVKFKKGVKMINHTDAGAYIMTELAKTFINENNYDNAFKCVLSAIIIVGHHIGLLQPKIRNEPGLDQNSLLTAIGEQEFTVLRDDQKVLDRCPNYKGKTRENETVMSYNNRHIAKWEQLHNTNVERDYAFSNSKLKPNDVDALSLRILFSCLIEGDHYDTTKHYQGRIIDSHVDLRPSDRLRVLDSYVSRLSNKKVRRKRERERNKIRENLYEDCKKVRLVESVYYCPALVGTGKTTASLALGFRLAKKYDLRHIFVVAPYTNIINQTVNTFRGNEDIAGAVVLDEENPFHVVGEHHHNADFFKENPDRDSQLAKIFATLWNCPIEVTTAVQFCETCASNHPSKLRKLNQLPGSVIIIDESEACVQLKHVRQIVRWLKILVEDWGCKVILMSGSIVKFWEIDDFKIDGIKPKSVVSRKTRQLMNKHEKQRLTNIDLGTLKFDGLIDKIHSVSGPVLCIFNTIMNSVWVTNLYGEKYGFDKVEHLSTVLSPNDIDNRLETIRKRLENKNDNNFVIFATSCVESGVDLPRVRNGFREYCSLRSALQIGGRVNRNDEYKDSCLYHFELSNPVSINYQFAESISVFKEFIADDKISDRYCTESIENEINNRNMNGTLYQFDKPEDEWDFSFMNDKFNVIESITKTIIIDENVKKKIINGEILYLSNREILRNSVRIRVAGKDENDVFRVKEKFEKYIDTISAELINEGRSREDRIKHDIYVWKGEYDNVFGYMKQFMKDLAKSED